MLAIFVAISCVVRNLLVKLIPSNEIQNLYKRQLYNNSHLKQYELICALLNILVYTPCTHTYGKHFYYNKSIFMWSSFSWIDIFVFSSLYVIAEDWGTISSSVMWIDFLSWFFFLHPLDGWLLFHFLFEDINEVNWHAIESHPLMRHQWWCQIISLR